MAAILSRPQYVNNSQPVYPPIITAAIKTAEVSSFPTPAISQPLKKKNHTGQIIDFERRNMLLM